MEAIDRGFAAKKAHRGRKRTVQPMLIHSDKKTGRLVCATSGSHLEDMLSSDPEFKEAYAVLDLPSNECFRRSLEFRVLVTSMALPSYDTPMMKIEANRTRPVTKLQRMHVDGLPTSLRIAITSLLQNIRDKCPTCPNLSTQFKTKCYNVSGIDLRMASMEQLRIIQHAGLGGDTDGIFPVDPDGRGGPRGCTIFNSCFAFNCGPGRARCLNPACTASRDLLLMGSGCVLDTKSNHYPDRITSDSNVVWDQFDAEEEVEPAAYSIGEAHPSPWSRPDMEVKTNGNVLQPTCGARETTYTNTCLEVMKACSQQSVDSKYQF